MDDPVQGDQIKSIVERVQRLQEEKRTIEDDIKEVYAEARGNGYDVKVLRAVVKHLGKDQNEIAEFDAIFDLYLQAYEHGAAPSRAYVARDAGTRTRELAPKTYPERASRSPEIAPPGLSTATQSEGAAGASPEEAASDSAAGDGDTIVSAQAAEFVTPAGEGEGGPAPADPAPAADGLLTGRKPFVLRPLCQHPEMCRGYGSKHCGACERSAKAPAVADDDEIEVPAFLRRDTATAPTIAITSGPQTGFWTPEIDERMRQLAPDHSAKQIAEMIGASRNAVIGRGRRRKIDLASPATKIQRGPILRIPIRKAAVRIANVLTPHPAIEPSKIDAHCADLQRKRELAMVAPADDWTPARVAFLDIRDGFCRWPLWTGRPPLAEKFFCGNPSEPGNSYCEHCRHRGTAPRAQVTMDRRLGIPKARVAA
jgi:uncharacterized protein (UPF0335 family)